VRAEAARLSLGEGWTPLLESERIAERLGVRRLWIKDEGQNPTGSFKARGLCLAVSRALELGAGAVALPSAGNAGSAAAAYGAAAGLPVHVVVPRDTPVPILEEISALGADLQLLDGLITDCAEVVRKGVEEHGWFDLSTLKEPYRVEGKKTMGYELAEQFGWTLPDWIIYPTGGGTGLVGMWKAFAELEAIGWLAAGQRPKMVSVQADGCAPIVRAFEQGADTAAPWEQARTVADGLRVPRAIGDFLILKAIRESGGTALAVSDAQMVDDMLALGGQEGVSAAPEGGAALAAVRRLVADGRIRKHETVVLFNTGGALKYLDVLRSVASS
jgi:threonine synthase